MERLAIRLLILFALGFVAVLTVIPTALMLYDVAQRYPAFEKPFIAMGWVFMFAALVIVVVEVYKQAYGPNKGEGK